MSSSSTPTYAKTASKAVGDTVTIGGTDFKVIGIVAATGSGLHHRVQRLHPARCRPEALRRDRQDHLGLRHRPPRPSDIDQIKTDLDQGAPDGDREHAGRPRLERLRLARHARASSIANLGTWLSIIVLAAAFLIAILFTISGVTRRTREFGTLKAIGWSNRRIVGQVAGESVVQGLIGGVIGIAVGLLGVLVINLIAPTLHRQHQQRLRDAAGAGRRGGQRRHGGTGAGGGRRRTAEAASAEARSGGARHSRRSATTDIALHAPVTSGSSSIAVGLAVLGGLLAGAIGGWRASRLRPAAALRSVA